jgi:predicted Zn-dependent protease
VLFGLARCRYSLHEVQESKQLLQQVLEQQPDHASALLDLGRVMIHEGRWVEAETWLRQAVAHSPRFHSEPVRVLCRCLEAANKTEEARQCAAELVQREAEVIEVERMTSQARREPLNSSLRMEIARKLMALGREQDGVAALMTLIDLDSRHEPAHEALAEFFERTGQTERALRHRRAQSPSSVKP